MRIRPELRPLLYWGCALTVAVILGMIALCLWRGNLRVHIATLALLTTTGPLIARVFEGLVRRVQRRRGLSMDCLEADDEVLLARTAPLVMPIAGALFSYTVMM
jgi:hypothetical protein